MANALKEGNNHHQGKHMRKRKQPSPFIVDEKKEMTITEVNTLKKKNINKNNRQKKGKWVSLPTMPHHLHHR